MGKCVIIENKKAYHDYFVEDTLVCGVSLKGNEVKSIRAGKASIKEAWVRVQNQELYLYGMHVSMWGTANQFDVNELRVKKLLAHKAEITELERSISSTGMTLVPLRVYFDNAEKCKVLIGLCRGKHNYDKREVLKKKQISRDIQRALKNS